MKKISELGLQLIELEDQVLLVDDKKLIINGYIQRGTEKPVINKPDFWFDFGVRYKNVIASTKPLEGLPLLVIEDEAMLNVLSLIEESKIENESTKLVLIGAYTTGYNKAKETYKFTELDLRFALDYGRSQGYEYASMETFQDSEDLKKLELEQKEDKEEFIQSLTKKELWIEVDGCSDCHLNDGYMSSPNCCREVQPKITNNQIKAVWK